VVARVEDVDDVSGLGEMATHYRAREASAGDADVCHDHGE
jgi:hypothetical protein